MTATDKTMLDGMAGDPIAATLLSLARVFHGSLTMGPPLMFNHDFRGTIVDKAAQLTLAFLNLSSEKPEVQSGSDVERQVQRGSEGPKVPEL